MLVNCKECGREISDTAKMCPFCGAKVKKAKTKVDRGNNQGSILSNWFKRVKDSKNGKVIYLGSLISSCVVAVCFLIITILSFAVPYAFLHSKLCADGYALIDKLAIKNQNRYDINIRGDRYIISRGNIGDRIVITISSNVLGNSGQVQYHFAKDGNIKANAFLNGYECVYEFENTYFVFTEAYYNYKPTSLSSAEMRLADSSIDLAEAVFNYVLALNNKDYDFYDILYDYAEFHSSLNATKVSSIVLMSIFSIASISGLVLYILFIRKKNENTLSEEDIINKTID